MNNKCQYLRIRTKNYLKYTYCIHFKAPTSTKECLVCGLYSHKQMFVKSPKKVLKTGVRKKVHKRAEQVNSDTYDFVYNRDKGRCVICGSNNLIALHHIVYRSQDKSKINDVDNCCMLCLQCHNKVHSNKTIYLPLLLTYIQHIKH